LYVPPAVTFRDCSLPTQCSDSFHMIIRTYSINCYNEHTMFLLCDRNQVFVIWTNFRIQKIQDTPHFTGSILIHAIIGLDTVHFLGSCDTDSLYNVFLQEIALCPNHTLHEI
jgi:hypothetical protein